MISMTAPERQAVAKAVGLNEQYLYQCLTGRRKTPPDHCPAIEAATGGRVLVEVLRPDIDWHRVPDESWPCPDGRPCIDVARSALRAITAPAEQGVCDAA